MPAIEADLAHGGHWTLAGEKAEKLALLVFYRGLHCPICRNWVGELQRLLPEFERRGVSVIALSCDSRDDAEAACKQWNLRTLRVGYGVEPEDARKAGLYLSERSETDPATGAEHTRLFAEPAVMAVQPEGTLYMAWAQSNAFARPHLSEVLAALDNMLARGLPEPRGAA